MPGAEHADLGRRGHDLAQLLDRGWPVQPLRPIRVIAGPVHPRRPLVGLRTPAVTHSQDATGSRLPERAYRTDYGVGVGVALDVGVAVGVGVGVGVAVGAGVEVSAGAPLGGGDEVGGGDAVGVGEGLGGAPGSALASGVTVASGVFVASGDAPGVGVCAAFG